MDTRILLVDDEPDIVLMIKEALQREGYQVDVATDGDAAVKKRNLNQILFC